MYVKISNWSKHRPFYDFFEWCGISNEANHKIHDWLKSLKLIERDQKVTIRVDSWDVWNADVTMARLISAVVTKFREDIQGYPQSLDIADANGLEDLAAWEYIIDEIIYVFSHYEDLIDYKDDYVANKARFDNGARLFAKYFQNIWN